MMVSCNCNECFSFNAADFASRAAFSAEASRAAEDVLDAAVLLETLDMLSSGSTLNRFFTYFATFLFPPRYSLSNRRFLERSFDADRIRTSYPRALQARPRLIHGSFILLTELHGSSTVHSTHGPMELHGSSSFPFQEFVRFFKFLDFVAANPLLLSLLHP